MKIKQQETNNARIQSEIKRIGSDERAMFKVYGVCEKPFDCSPLTK